MLGRHRSSLETRLNLDLQIINRIKTLEASRLEIIEASLEFVIQLRCKIMLALQRLESRLNDFSDITVLT